MICASCQTAADGVGCPVCGRPIKRNAYGQTNPHKVKPRGDDCGGSFQPRELGHLMCKGCACQHEPPGTIIIKR